MCYRYWIAAIGQWCGLIGGGRQHIILGGFGIGLRRRHRIFFPPSCDVETHLSVLPLIFLFQMAFTFKILFVPFVVHYFHHNMFVVIGWEDYVIQWSLMMMILMLYHITINILRSFQTVYLTLSFWPRFCPWPIIKRAEYLQYTLQHPCTSKIFTKRWSWVNTRLQKVDVSSLQPSTFIGHTSTWWQQTPSSTNESELCCSH